MDLGVRALGISGRGRGATSCGRERQTWGVLYTGGRRRLDTVREVFAAGSLGVKARQVRFGLVWSVSR